MECDASIDVPSLTTVRGPPTICIVNAELGRLAGRVALVTGDGGVSLAGRPAG